GGRLPDAGARSGDDGDAFLQAVRRYYGRAGRRRSHVELRAEGRSVVSEEHRAGTVVDVRCRLFESPTEGGGGRYANPPTGWDPNRDERGLACPRWLVVEVGPSTGIVGIGDAALAADLIPPIVETRLKPLVVGRPVASIQETWQLMYRGTMAWGRKGLGMVAISSVDLALWDALGKALGAPVYDLLGGRGADSIRVYASRLYGSD